ncbi:MAG: nucleoside phosphorylase [Bacteroidota bacterium]
MTPPIAHSELIINPDGSVYHLGLLPEDVAPVVITVGDQDRVSEVSKYFERIEVDKQHREFKTHTGRYRGKRITVTSTGIGTDNIDIVLNEMDALVNIDFETRRIHKKHTPLTFVRIGTCGALQPTVAVDSFFVTERAVGFDNLLHFYEAADFLDEAFSQALMTHFGWNPNQSTPYVVEADAALLKRFDLPAFQRGTTATNVGFYGPQGRKLRLGLRDDQWNDKMRQFRYYQHSIDTLEMETSAIYGMARLLGHSALSISAVLANRAKGSFSDKPGKTVDSLIKTVLDVLVL